jgi:hypothetical protein
MSVILGTYSGRDMSFTLTSPLIGSIQATGVSGQGIASVTVRKTVIQSTMQVGMDGAVVPSVAPGDQGEIEVQIWQTSSLQKQFLSLYNAMQAAELTGDVTNWFGATIVVVNTLDGSSHTGTGAAPQKVPDKAYQEQAGRISWIFVCSNVINQ